MWRIWWRICGRVRRLGRLWRSWFRLFGKRVFRGSGIGLAIRVWGIGNVQLWGFEVIVG